MWRRSGWIAGLVVAMLVATAVPIQAKTADHRVNGGGHLVTAIGNEVSVRVNARSFGDPLTGTGTVVIRSSGSINHRMRIDVDCVRVDLATGKAWMSGVVAKTAGDGWDVGHGVLVIVRDVAGGPDELVSILGNPKPGPFPTPACLTDVIGTASPFDRGNIRVR